MRTAATVVDIQYETVLNNLARMAANPADLPSHLDLADGVVQVSDEASFGRAGGFDSLAGGGGGFGIDRFGPAAGRQISEQWGADATTDPQRLVDLQDLYRCALGLPPLPPPLAIALLRDEQERSGETVGGSSGGSGSGGGSGGSPDDAGSPPDDSPAGGGSSDGNSSDGGSSGGGGSGGGSGNRRVPIDVLLNDVPPPGWFGVGCEDDVPDCACYVGRHGDRYAWVLPGGMPGLSRFTVTVLSVVKFKPGPGGGGGSGGLVVTP